MKGRVELIDSKIAGEFLLPRHYTGRLPCISQALNYPVLPYPKYENQNYILGTVYEPEIIKV